MGTTTTTTAPTTTTSVSTSTTTTPTSTILSTTSTTTATCGFIPTKCNNAINRGFNMKDTKSYGKFEELTGVSQADATKDDMTLYFKCKGRAATKCEGLQYPCTCSSPPCTCPGDTTTTTMTTTTTSTSPSTTMTTTTKGSSERCAL